MKGEKIARVSRMTGGGQSALYAENTTEKKHEESGEMRENASSFSCFWKGFRKCFLFFGNVMMVNMICEWLGLGIMSKKVWIKNIHS